MQYSDICMVPRGQLEPVNTTIAAKDKSHARGTGNHLSSPTTPVSQNTLERAIETELLVDSSSSMLIGGQDLHIKSSRTGRPERHLPGPPPSTFSDQLRRTRIETHWSGSRATDIGNCVLWSNFDDNWFSNKWLPIRCSQFRRKTTQKWKPKWRMNWVSYAPNHRSPASLRVWSEISHKAGSLQEPNPVLPLCIPLPSSERDSREWNSRHPP